MSNRPSFIPKDQIVKGVNYPGYLAYSDGLVSQEAATFYMKGQLGSKNRRMHVKNPGPVPVPDWGVSPIRKRTPQERAESLAKRIYSQYQKGGLTEGVFREVQAVCWDEGMPVSFDQARELAEHYLRKNEIDQRQIDNQKVTTKSPYVLSPGPGQQGAQSPSAREG